MPTVQQLNRIRADYEPAWDLYEALYRGGRAIHRPERLAELMPKHAAETDAWYQERLRRFSYRNIVGPVIDEYAATVTQGGLEVLPARDPRTGERPEVDTFYTEELLQDPTGTGEGNLRELAHAWLVQSMIFGEGWLFIGYDAALPGYQYMSRAEQEAAGALRTKLRLVDPRNIINVGTDRNGIAWVMMRERVSSNAPLADPGQDFDVIRWTLIDRKRYTQWELETERGAFPSDVEEARQVVPPTEHRLSLWGEDQGGAVPIVRMKQPDGLWLMDKVHSLVLEEVGKRNALSWYEYLSCFPQLKHTGAEPLKRDQEDGDRRNRARGVQYVWELDEGESLEWLEVSGSTLEHLQSRLETLERDIYRTLAHMAAAQVPGAAAVMQSGASKVRDYVSKVILCTRFAARLRDALQVAMEYASFSRGDDIAWEIGGLDRFDTMDEETAVDTALKLQAIPDFLSIPSWSKAILRRTARATLPGAEQQVIDQIEEEIAQIGEEPPENMNTEQGRASRPMNESEEQSS